ncbi:MAG: sulfite exporter TauE/SafE family protein [Methylococcus sp.]|nr:sulfite exporter TauE/SafE family protein [Methylococcus sp.]
MNSTNAANRQSISNPSSWLRRPGAIVLGVVGVFLILFLDERMGSLAQMPTLGRDMNYWLLFVTGLLTGFHCVGMCGALVLAYATKSASGGKASPASHLLYGAGKTLSYTAIGAIFGLIGSIFSFSPALRGIIGIAAGLFLVLFSLGMLQWVPALSHFQIKTPSFLLRFIGTQSKQSHSPFVIGLLNGLMIICGPLQAMYVMAAGTGSPIEGALLMFFFGLGTLPVMLSFGWFATLISAGLKPKLVRFSGVIVLVLGILMINRGLKASGSGLDFHSVLVGLSRFTEAHWGLVLATPEAPMPENMNGMVHNH